MAELYHHGILGQRWGIRRYQNKDGTLTEEGKARLRENKSYDDFRKNHYNSGDIYLKKGTKVSQVATIGRQKSSKKLDKYNQKLVDAQTNARFKNVYADGTRLTNKHNGVEHEVLDRFLNYHSSSSYINNYKLKDNLQVASGKKVLEEVLKYMENKPSNLLSDFLSEKNVRTGLDNDPVNPKNRFDWDLVKSLRNEYRFDSETYDAVNSRLYEKGYKAITNIGESDIVDMPITILDNSVLVKIGSETEKDILKKIGNEKLVNKKSTKLNEPLDDDYYDWD
jgi:hypothetical protein